VGAAELMTKQKRLCASLVVPQYVRFYEKVLAAGT
jgi:hypothetical protein